jgi:hypothetical protein
MFVGLAWSRKVEIMAPEAPADLVVLDLRFENGTLKANVQAMEPSREMKARDERVHVSWNADSPPAGYFSTSGNAVYVRDIAELQKECYSVEIEHANGKYTWRYPTATSMMFVLVFPAGYLLAECEPKPTRAKIVGNRLAAYWIFSGPNRPAGVAELQWSMRAVAGAQEIASTATRINQAAMARPAARELPVVLDPRLGDRAAAWVLGGLTMLFLMGLVFFGPADLPADYTPIIRFIAGLSGGLLSYFFVGNLHLGGRIPGLETDVKVAAVGGFAVFVFVMLFWSH